MPERDVTTLVAPNPSPMTGRGTNTYVLGHGDAVVVIDPGPGDPAHLGAIQSEVDARGRAGLVVVTHHHEDHSESAGELASSLGAVLAAHPHPSLTPARALRDGEEVEAGTDRLRVMLTPGHAPDHLCLEWLGRSVVFAGDLVAGEGFIVINPPEGDMTAYLSSLERVRASGVGTILPGHGPVIGDAQTYLATYISHRMDREEKVLAAVRAEASSHPDGTTTTELLPRAYADTPVGMYPVAERSLVAHLEKLARDGAVLITRDPGVGERYRPAD